MKRFRITALPIVALVVLIQGCGCTGEDDDGEETIIADAADDDSESNDADDGDDGSDAHDDSESNDADDGDDGSDAHDDSESNDDGDDGDNGGSNNSADELAVGDNAAALVDQLFGGIDNATYDGNKQCLSRESADDRSSQEGIRPANAPVMMADGSDIFAFCVIEASVPAEPVLTITAPNGVPVAEASLVTVDGYGRAAGQFSYDRAADVVFAAVDGSLVPVGYSAEPDGRHITTLVIELPLNRPSGEWTVTYRSSSTPFRSLGFAAAPCDDGAVGSDVWHTDPGLRVQSGVSSANLIDVVGGQWPELEWLDHCRLVPDVRGNPVMDATKLLADAREPYGEAKFDYKLSCEDGLDVGKTEVIDQLPRPTADLERVGAFDLTYIARCAPMPDVIGRTVAEARTIIETEPGLGDLPNPPAVLVGTDCPDDDAVVTSSRPAFDEADYVVDGGLQISVGCGIT